MVTYVLIMCATCLNVSYSSVCCQVCLDHLCNFYTCRDSFGLENSYVSSDRLSLVIFLVKEIAPLTIRTLVPWCVHKCVLGTAVMIICLGHLCHQGLTFIFKQIKESLPPPLVGCVHKCVLGPARPCSKLSLHYFCTCLWFQMQISQTTFPVMCTQVCLTPSAILLKVVFLPHEAWDSVFCVCLCISIIIIIIRLSSCVCLYVCVCVFCVVLAPCSK